MSVQFFSNQFLDALLRLVDIVKDESTFLRTFSEEIKRDPGQSSNNFQASGKLQIRNQR